MAIKLISTDLNGTLVRQHTMSDMILKYVGRKQFERANTVFKQQTSGTATMQAAFANAAPLTAGITLREAIEYTQKHMTCIDGFSDFFSFFQEHDISSVINSTGYSVTIYAIQANMAKIDGIIGNRLIFSYKNDDSTEELTEEELKQLVFAYFSERYAVCDNSYDRIIAAGKVELGICDEDAKATLLTQYAAEHFPGILPNEMLHMGDTMGDSGGIYGIAKAGGLGVAFNFNKALEDYLREKIMAEPDIKDRIFFIDPKGPDSNLMNVLKEVVLASP
ncbi:MAG: hypothetical protein HQ564_02675 [Candidatus Saganbacteria bacterium]|nr:hypothetical protein [Candidatus Saganbacteria bacterium]